MAATDADSRSTLAKTIERKDKLHPLRSHPLVDFYILGFTESICVGLSDVDSLKGMQDAVQEVLDAQIEMVIINGSECSAHDATAMRQHLKKLDVDLTRIRVSIGVRVKACPVRSVHDILQVCPSWRAWTLLLASGTNRWHDLQILPSAEAGTCHCTEWTRYLAQEGTYEWKRSRRKYRLTMYKGGIVDGTFAELHQRRQHLQGAAYILKWRQKCGDGRRFFERKEIMAVNEGSMDADFQLMSHQGVSTLHSVAIVQADTVGDVSLQDAFKPFTFRGYTNVNGQSFGVFGDSNLCGACSSSKDSDLSRRLDAAGKVQMVMESLLSPLGRTSKL